MNVDFDINETLKWLVSEVIDLKSREEYLRANYVLLLNHYHPNLKIVFEQEYVEKIKESNLKKIFALPEVDEAIRQNLKDQLGI